MVRPINKDPLSLGKVSLPADLSDPLDLAAGQDLLDTLLAHTQDCVGMAANMIGVHKRIIAVHNDAALLLMYNPELLAHSGGYETEEGCLSLEGVHTVRRFRTVKIRYQNARGQTRVQSFTGFTAQIIQHELDHCNGVLI